MINPLLVRSDDMIADAITKPLDRGKHGKILNYMLNQDQSWARDNTMGALSAKVRRAWKQLRDTVQDQFGHLQTDSHSGFPKSMHP